MSFPEDGESVVESVLKDDPDRSTGPDVVDRCGGRGSFPHAMHTRSNDQDPCPNGRIGG